MMRLGLQTMTGYRDTAELARWAESAGIDCLSVADHYLSDDDPTSPALDQLVVLGGIARETSTIELATLVSPLTFRHPAVMWKQAVTLDEMSGGRFSLGLGAGWMEPEHSTYGLDFPPRGERFDRLEEGLGYLRAAIEGRGFEGRFFRLADVATQPRPVNLRLIVGGSGPDRTPDMAGRFADEFNVIPGKTPIADRVARARQTAEATGRRMPLVSVAFPAVAGPTDEAYRLSLESLAAARGKQSEEFASRLTELQIPHGTPTRLREGVDRLRSAGVEMIHLQVSRNGLSEIRSAVEAYRSAIDG